MNPLQGNFRDWTLNLLPVQPRTSTCLEFKAKSTAFLSLISFLADLTKSAPAEKSVFDTAGNFVNRLIHDYDINTGVMVGPMVNRTAIRSSSTGSGHSTRSARGASISPPGS